MTPTPKPPAEKKDRRASRVNPYAYAETGRHDSGRRRALDGRPPQAAEPDSSAPGRQAA